MVSAAQVQRSESCSRTHTLRDSLPRTDSRADHFVQRLWFVLGSWAVGNLLDLVDLPRLRYTCPYSHQTTSRPTTMTQIESPTPKLQTVTSACEFCVELRTPESSRFFKIYGPKQRHRFVARHGPYVAMPTIGQVFAGSLLVLPFEHRECFAELPNQDLEELPAFLVRLMQRSLGSWVAGSTPRRQQDPGVRFRHPPTS